MAFVWVRFLYCYSYWRYSHRCVYIYIFMRWIIWPHIVTQRSNINIVETYLNKFSTPNIYVCMYIPIGIVCLCRVSYIMSLRNIASHVLLMIWPVFLWEIFRSYFNYIVWYNNRMCTETNTMEHFMIACIDPVEARTRARAYEHTGTRTRARKWENKRYGAPILKQQQWQQQQ